MNNDELSETTPPISESPVHTADSFQDFIPLINDSSAFVAVSAMKTSQLLLENAAYFVPMDLWVVSQVVIHQRLGLPKFLYI